MALKEKINKGREKGQPFKSMEVPPIKGGEGLEKMKVVQQQ